MEEKESKRPKISDPENEDRKVLDGQVFGVSVVGKHGGSFAERRAAKFGSGFNAPRINTARFRTTSPVPTPGIWSPCLTIPPGISPTAFLDSPIMLANTQALPSPTTGTFRTSLNDDCPMPDSVMLEEGYKSSSEGSFFRFMTHEDHSYLSGFLSFENQGDDADYQALISKQPPVNFEFPVDFPQETITINCKVDSSTDMNDDLDMIMTTKCDDFQAGLSNEDSNRTTLPNKPIIPEDVDETHNPVEGDQNGPYPSSGTTRNSEDGYNWRKYGQKQVKGSEYPRSYYKCTHPNCQVKKKVERSYDGQITEIIYKGAHNHAKPQLNRRASLGSALSGDKNSEMGEGSVTHVKEVGPVWVNVPSDWRADGLERTPSASVLTELSDPLSNTQGKNVGVFGSDGTPELSSTLASHDDDDGVTQGSISFGDDGDDEESGSKRRRKEGCLIESNLASRVVREPRVVVQIETEVDILDDGYRWRKYGQKVVKGNPNPRSYYKCTSPGCSVRKHVERAPHNLKFVLTTYEGKHNHAVPASRNGSQINSNGDNANPSGVNAQLAMALSRNINAPKPETQIQDLETHFERKPEFHNEYLRSGFLGNFNNEMKFGASSIYPVKLPSVHNMMPYGSFGLNHNHSLLNHAGSMTSAIPEFPIILPPNIPACRNFSPAGYEFNGGRSVVPIQPFNDAGFVKPKQEQKDDNLYDAFAPFVDHANGSSSSRYHNIMGNFQ